MIETDLQGFKGQSRLVFLGDYIDRGPDSRGVIDLLLGGNLPGNEQVFLKGNHEAVLLDILQEGGKGAADWLTFGGYETLASYGVAGAQLANGGKAVVKAIDDAFPDDHVEFLRSLEPSFVQEPYFFAHAGVRPGVPIHAQADRDLMWIRESFLSSDRDHGHVVVHGHTIEKEPASRHNRIGIDTGCYAGGSLTAVRLEGNAREFFSVGQRER